MNATALHIVKEMQIIFMKYLWNFNVWFFFLIGIYFDIWRKLFRQLLVVFSRCLIETSVSPIHFFSPALFQGILPIFPTLKLIPSFTLLLSYTYINRYVHIKQSKWVWLVLCLWLKGPLYCIRHLIKIMGLIPCRGYSPNIH